MSSPYMLMMSALLREGREAIAAAVAAGISTEHIRDASARQVWKHLTDFLQQYDGAPSRASVYGELAIDVGDPPPEPPDYWIDQVKAIHLHAALEKSHLEIGKLLEGGNTLGAYEALEKAILELREGSLVPQRVVHLFSLADEVYDRYQAIKGGMRGVPFPWPSLNEATMGMWPEDLILLCARTGQGKCLDGAALITDPITGLRTSMGKAVESGVSSTYTWSREGGVHVETIDRTIVSGERECLRLRLRTGRELVVTPEHKVLTPGGWIPAEELPEYVTLAVPSHLPEPSRPEELPDEEVDLLAIMLAEGSYTGHHVSFTSTDAQIIDRAEAGGALLGATMHRAGKFAYAFRGVGTRSHPNPVRGWLKRHGMDGKKAVEKTFPAPVYRLPNVQLARFLSVFWMCDGYVDKNGPCLVLASEEMLVEIQHLLLRLGIQSTIRPKPSRCEGKVFPAWRLRVHSDCNARMAAVFSMWGEKQARLDKLALRGRNPNLGFPSVPVGMREDLRARFDGRGPTATREIARLLGRRRLFMFRELFSHDGKRVMTGTLKAFCEVLGGQEAYSWLWDSELYWDELEAVDDAGSRECYDFTVSPTSCFVANDVVLHNSWMMAVVALHAWEQGHKVLFATTELSQRVMAQRLFSAHLGVPYTGIYRGRLSNDHEQLLGNLVTAPPPNWENFDLIGGDFDFRIESLFLAIKDASPDLVILDGAYLLKTKGVTRTEQAAEAFNELKRVAKRAKVPIVTTTQFNRAAAPDEEKTLTLRNIGLTDAAGWNSDLVFALFQTDEMQRDLVMKLKCLKGRETFIRDLMLHWDFFTMDFTEIPKVGGGDADDAAGLGDPDLLPF